MFFIVFADRGDVAMATGGLLRLNSDQGTSEAKSGADKDLAGT